MVLYDALITPSFSAPLASLVGTPLLLTHLSCRRTSLVDAPLSLAHVLPPPLCLPSPSRPVSTRFARIHAIRAPFVPRPVPCPRDLRTSTQYARDHAIHAQPCDTSMQYVSDHAIRGRPLDSCYHVIYSQPRDWCVICALFLSVPIAQLVKARQRCFLS